MNAVWLAVRLRFACGFAVHLAWNCGGSVPPYRGDAPNRTAADPGRTAPGLGGVECSSPSSKERAYSSPFTTRDFWGCSHARARDG